jgi:2'-5' RNA ligase
MLQTDCEAQLVGQYALVNYVPGALGKFLDELRLELTPGCNPRAHVTVLPPRPLCRNPEDAVREISGKIGEAGPETAPFTVELSSVEIFAGSNVVYMELDRGGEELRRLYRSLNSGALGFAESFPYHPHITLAQHLMLEEADMMARHARERWAAWEGARTFVVTEVLLVRNVAPTIWEDVATVQLGSAVPVGS